MFDEKLAIRIRETLREERGITERKMFGGIAFLDRGHMFCGIVKRDLMVRVGVAEFDNALRNAHVRPMDFTGRPSRGMVYVAPNGIRREQALREWVARGLRFTRTLPAKKEKG